jgi:uncharacterized RDD family membrane protein YckC
MKAASVRWFLIAYVVLTISAIAIDSPNDESGIGVSLNWVNGNYSFSGGAPPWVLAFAAADLALYAVLFFSHAGTTSGPMPHLFRRFFAGMADWFLSILIGASLFGLVSVLIEYRQTGVFEWVIDRQEPRPFDLLQAFVGVLGTFAAMVVYTALPLSRGKPTPGACMAGYRIAADEGSQLTIWFAALRALLGSVALLGWPCWILAFALKRDKEHGKFWLDNIFRTHAEFLKPGHLE